MGTSVIVPIAVVVVLPVLIVWLVNRTYINRENRRTEIMLEALKQGANIDVDKLADFIARDRRTPRELRNLRLLRGSVFTLIGVAFAIVALVIGMNGGADVEDLLGILVISAVCLAVGIGYLIVFFVSGRDAENE